MRSKYTYDYPLTCLCNLSSMLNTSLTSESANNFSLSSSSEYSCYNCITPKRYASPSSSTLLINNSTLISNDEIQLPNKALLSFIILFGTCFIAVALKFFRRSNFFGRTVS